MTKALQMPLIAGGIALIAILAVFAAFSGTASAHQAATFDPADPNCMGKLTSFHAKDDGGIKNSAAIWPHVGIGGPHDGETVKGFQELSLAWCHSE